MAYVPMNRARALIICTRPQDYAPSRLPEAVAYLLQPSASSKDAGLNGYQYICPDMKQYTMMLVTSPLSIVSVGAYQTLAIDR